jgi:hypothetical protein
MRRRRVMIAAICLTVQAVAFEAAAQEEGRCRFVCAPTIEVAPTTTIGNLLFAPRVTDVSDGVPQHLTRDTEFELVVSADIPTRFPRLDFALEVHWTPWSGVGVNPFTGRTAEDLGVSTIRDNHVELESEINLTLIPEERTGGWVEVHFDVLDNFSPAQRALDRSVYTHKLDFELDTSISPFNRLPEKNWLRNIDVEASLDYMATGLPKAGDEVGGDSYLDDASRWSFGVAIVIPLTPR